VKTAFLELQAHCSASIAKLGGKPESDNMEMANSTNVRISRSAGFWLCAYGAKVHLPMVLPLL
jgi:hypothetical protein